MKKNPIVVIAAMEVECDFLIEKLNNCKKIKEGYYSFFEGEMNSYPVVVALSDVGIINSAVVTYIAINKYNPIAIINEGTAGAHDRNIHTGDIIIRRKVY